MTAGQLRDFRRKVPFKPFVIQMTDGTSFPIKDPEDRFIHPDCTVDAIVLQPCGRFSFIYLKNVSSVLSEGKWPGIKGRRGRGKNGHETE